MTLSASSKIDIAELICYVPLIPVTLYLGWRHGKSGLLGYFYLHVACVLRLVSDIVSLVMASPQGSVSIAPVVLSSIGLTPVILAISGFCHELHKYLVLDTAFRPAPASTKKTLRWMWVVQWHIHGLTVIAMVLFVIGGVHAATAQTAQDVSSADNLRKAGCILLGLVWLALSKYAIYLQIRGRRHLQQDYTVFANGIFAATICAGARVVYTIVYVFDTSDAALSPIAGSIVIRVILVFLATLFAVVAMVFTGWYSIPTCTKFAASTASPQYSDSGEVHHVAIGVPKQVDLSR